MCGWKVRGVSIVEGEGSCVYRGRFGEVCL